MVDFSTDALQEQIEREIGDLESSAGLPFRELLSGETVAEAMERAGVEFRNRIYNPMVTLWAFLSQVIAQKESSCQDSVSRVIADRVARGEKACSEETTSYCTARQRLPQQIVVDLVRRTGRELHRRAPEEWLWKGRRVVLVDGSTATMEDTPENQQEFPQSRSQKPGLGFPILRFVVLFSLSVGTSLECALGAHHGKKTGEQTLFRQTWDALGPGDVVVGDRLYDSYRDMAQLKGRRIDTLFGMRSSRRPDFRKGRKLGRDDHVVTWKRPKYDSSRYESRAEWESLPETMEIREVRRVVRRKGFRDQKVVIVTTLLDAEQYPAADLAALFGERWNCELDLRSIKQALGMHHIACKTPAMVRKALWVHLLAYNLIRVRMAQAAALCGKQPRRLSFTSAKNHIHNFAPYMSVCDRKERDRLEVELLSTIAASKLKERPHRKEPRAVKKRQQKYPSLTKPRAKARKELTS
jgi:hypothetical protein